MTRSTVTARGFMLRGGLIAAVLIAALPLPVTGIDSWYPAANANGDPVQAVFESRLPCLDADARASKGCERVKFGIALYADGAGDPSTYLMTRIYVGGDEARRNNEGRWSLAEGTISDPDATVYRLDDAAPADFRAFWKLSDDVLMVLDGSQPRVGDAAYGYALNRVR